MGSTAHKHFTELLQIPVQTVKISMGDTVFARAICALFFFPILAAEKSGCVKYADIFCGGLDLGFILV